MQDMDPFAWLVVTVAGLIGVIWTIISKHKATLAAPQGPSEVEVRAEEKAAAETKKAVEAHDAAVAEAKAEAEKAGADLDSNLEKNKDKLLGDPDALNDYLKNVGKDVRGSGG